MDFSEVSIPDVLYGAIPNRFQDFTPSDFEDFIAQLFKDNGYSVEQTKYSGDYGADLLASTKSEKIAIQVKRFAEDTKVGVQAINQVAGPRDYYGCDRAMVITTSGYTKAGTNLASTVSIELWDWDKLQKSIFDTYFGGLDYYSFFSDIISQDAHPIQFDFDVKLVEQGASLVKGDESVTILYIDIANRSNENIYIQMLLPEYVNARHHQFSCNCYITGHFTQGVIYAHCTVQYVVAFLSDYLPEVSVGDRLIFKYTLDEETLCVHEHTFPSVPETVNPSLELAKRTSSDCFLTTVCFGSSSPQCRHMLWFRDHTLSKSWLGHVFIANYYRYGASLADRVVRWPVAKLLVRCAMTAVFRVVRRINRLNGLCAVDNGTTPMKRSREVSGSADGNGSLIVSRPGSGQRQRPDRLEQ